MNNDLISRDALKKAINNLYNETLDGIVKFGIEKAYKEIDNAPTVDSYPFEQVQELVKLNQQFAQEIENLKRPQGEYVDISKLRLMTVEECAGHTIDYAMGWKACIEWIKNGGDMKEDRRND